MTRLLHGLRHRDAVVGGLGEVARPQSMRGKLPRIETSQLHALLDDRIDGLRIEPPLRNSARCVSAWNKGSDSLLMKSSAG